MTLVAKRSANFPFGHRRACVGRSWEHANHYLATRMWEAARPDDRLCVREIFPADVDRDLLRAPQVRDRITGVELR